MPFTIAAVLVLERRVANNKRQLQKLQNTLRDIERAIINGSATQNDELKTVSAKCVTIRAKISELYIRLTTLRALPSRLAILPNADAMNDDDVDYEIIDASIDNRVDDAHADHVDAAHASQTASPVFGVSE